MGLVSSGCITVSAPASLIGQKKKTAAQQVSYEEELPETPQDPKDPEQLKLAYARWMEDVNQVVEARKHYSSVTQTEPENVDAILGLARLDQVTGQYAEAEQKFKRAIRIAPDSPETQYGLGQFYASQERWSEAIEPLNAALLGAPENTTFRYQLAVALVHTGDVNAALPHFIRTVGDAEGHYNVGLILQEQNRLDEAEKHFLLAVTKKPQLKQAEQWLTRLRAQRQGSATPPRSVGQHPPSQIIPASHRSQKPEIAAAETDFDVATSRPLNRQQREQLQNQEPLATR